MVTLPRDAESGGGEVRSEHTEFNGDHRSAMSASPAAQDHPSTKLVVAGAQAPAQPQAGSPARSGAPAHHGGDLALADMEYMVPSDTWAMR